MKALIVGGGTVFHVRPHLALCAPAYGSTARQLDALCSKHWRWHDLLLTRMAGGDIETNADIARYLNDHAAEYSVIFMTAAMCDFEGHILDDDRDWTLSGKDRLRLSSAQRYEMSLSPAEKVIRALRKERKDLFLVGCKTTTGATQQEQFDAGLKLLKQSSCNLVLANDLHTKMNMIVTPEQAPYCITNNRERVLTELVDMTRQRSQLHFTRSTVVEGDLVRWDNPSIPQETRRVVDGLIARGAYRPFLGKTVGHFAVKLADNKFLTSKRGDNYNEIGNSGLVYVETDGPDKVIAHGAKPSVGGQSQRAVFASLPNTDSIVHAHLQVKPGSKVPVRSQREFECGSHECGDNTAAGLKQFGNVWAVMLDKHGPNIVFDSKTARAEEVLQFIDDNFYFDKHTSEVST